MCSAGSTFAESLDMLYKMFWVFQWEYPKGTKFFFNFLQKVMSIRLVNSMPERVKKFFNQKEDISYVGCSLTVYFKIVTVWSKICIQVLLFGTEKLLQFA